MNQDTKISIVCPSYNHGRFVGDFIRSLLAQTDGRWELIIIDDASDDDNLSKIKTFNDPRIRLFARAANRGVSAGMIDGVRAAGSPLVAFIASDDCAAPTYVERITTALETNMAAIVAYVSLERVDEKGSSIHKAVVLPLGHSRTELLRRSFLGQNQLPSPGMAIRREVALELLPPEGSVQYSDWILQNRLLMRGEVVMLEEQLVRYRVSSTSLSARSVASIARDALETRIMMDDFLKIQDMDFLAQVFPVEMKPYAGLPLRHLPYVLGRLALLSEIPEKRCWGYEIIMRHLSDPGVAESLHAHAGFTHRDLMAITPTENAARTEEVRQLRRRLRHLRRWALVLTGGLALALLALLR
jgi:hypothetical protein